MAIGTGNRVVIEIDAEEKQRIYAALKARGMTMREWFLLQARDSLLGGQAAGQVHTREKINNVGNGAANA